MRLNYYEFPCDFDDENVLLENGCAIVTKSGDEIYTDHIPDEHRKDVDHIEHRVGPVSVTKVKELIRKYGGSGWTEHIDRDGTLFETSEIELTGNNSKFRYNQHL